MHLSTAETDLPRQATVDEIIASHAGQPGALLPVLHAIQEAFGYIEPAQVGVIADALNLSRAEVHGVITFYHYFRQRPAGRHVIHVCRAEACQAMHCEQTEQHAKACLGVDYGGTSADGVFTLAAAYCLGNCAAAPSVMIGEKLYGRVTPQRLDEMLADWRNRT
jgi:formate dehydrogenase subunit gamma